MPDAVKAVEVAKDVIKQLEAKENPYIARCGVYLASYNRYFLPYTGDLQEHVDLLQRGQCQVCAVGATLLSKARLYDNVPLSKFHEKSYHDLLSDIFDKQIVYLMEACFERWLKPSDTLLEWVGDNEKYRRAAYLGYQYEDAKERMKAIMENIIENGGVFNPPPVPDDIHFSIARDDD